MKTFAAARVRSIDHKQIGTTSPAAPHAWLIGAGSGMGLELGRLLAKAGRKVILSARNHERLTRSAAGIGALTAPLDITDKGAVAACAKRLFDGSAPNLVLVNAGCWPRETVTRAAFDRFKALGPDSLESLVACFGDTARFVDPFNDVRGAEAIRRVFERMFATCDGPSFEVGECVGEDTTYYLRWRFGFGRERSWRALHGVSRVQFGPDGLVLEHADYWDPASQLYEKIPILGRLLRALRSRLSAPQPIRTTTGTSEGVPPATQR